LRGKRNNENAILLGWRGNGNHENAIVPDWRGNWDNDNETLIRELRR